MNMALQLHEEARSHMRPVSTQDIDLHRRLLQQLNKDCAAMHDVFFKTTVKERMSMLALDHEIRQRVESAEEKKVRVNLHKALKIET